MPLPISRASTELQKRRGNAACPHRGPVLQTVSGRVAGSGCSSSTAEVYECRHFHEPVLKAGKPPCEDTMREQVAGWKGRTCRGCKIPTAKPERLPATDDPATVTQLAAVTCYFNPQHSINRRNNWFRFAEGLADQGVYLLTIEGVRDGDEPDLPGVHSVRQVRFRDVLWHKERLLNLAIQSLPDSIDAVAWIDADVVWPGPDIARKTLDALCRWPVVQPWSTCTMLGPHGEKQPWFGGKDIISTGAHNQGGKSRDGNPHRSHPGFAWAARRATLDAIGGLYDRHITGAGDTAMVLGFFGDFASPFLAFDRMSAPMLAHWKAWAERAYTVVGGRVGYVDCEIKHLYHGEIKHRGYEGRWKGLASHGYNPAAHVTSDDGGPLR